MGPHATTLIDHEGGAPEAKARVAYGDWQTPHALAERVLDRVLALMPSPPQTIVEPTCGRGAFLAAAQKHLPQARALGWEINPAYVEAAESAGLSVRQADFFHVDWEDEIRGLAEPILVVGNPPWVTRAGLGVIGADNAPSTRNFKGLRGIDALTGKGNFDVSEWMILRLLGALAGREATLAMLCKSAVARRVIEDVNRRSLAVAPGAIFKIDAHRHFDASVDAVLFTCTTSSTTSREPLDWPLHASLDDALPQRVLGVADGTLVADVVAHARTKALGGASDPEWRSGIKHDCARVMELYPREGQWVNAEGEIVDIEPEHRYPLLKGSDVANGELRPARRVIVPQRFLGDDTTRLVERAPKLWAYLDRHQELFRRRKSSIYQGKPPFAIFGVGAYSFAPWKVVVSGLHKHTRFRVVGPEEGKATMVDDTCYFLPFSTEPEARRIAEALSSELAHDFFRGRVFWDAKRPISKGVLQTLDLRRLLDALGDALP